MSACLSEGTWIPHIWLGHCIQCLQLYYFSVFIHAAFGQARSDFRQLLQCEWDLPSSGILHNVEWQFVTNVLGKPVGPTFKGQVPGRWDMTLWDGTYRLSVKQEVRNYHLTFYAVYYTAFTHITNCYWSCICQLWTALFSVHGDMSSSLPLTWKH
jgi:hypothetical protein